MGNGNGGHVGPANIRYVFVVAIRFLLEGHLQKSLKDSFSAEMAQRLKSMTKKISNAFNAMAPCLPLSYSPACLSMTLFMLT